MPNWNGSIINRDQRYRTQTNSQARGIYSLNEQLQHERAGNWPNPPTIMTEDTGFHPTSLSIIETTTNADSTANFSVLSLAMPANVEIGRIYLAVKVTANTTFYNDFCIGGVQIVTGQDEYLHADNDFMMHDDSSTWQTGSAVTAANNTISSISGYSWTNIAAGATRNIWNRATSTVSSRTGAAGGLSTATGYNMQSELNLSEGNNDAEITQTGSNYYIFTETSGSPHGAVIWTRSPEFEIDGFEEGSRLVIAYHACTSSGGLGMINTVAEPLLTVFWVEA